MLLDQPRFKINFCKFSMYFNEEFMDNTLQSVDDTIITNEIVDCLLCSL